MNDVLKKLKEEMTEAVRESKKEFIETAAVDFKCPGGAVVTVEMREDGSTNVEIASTDGEKEERDYPNVVDKIRRAVPDWEDVTVEPEPSYDEWNEHGFRDAADYYRWRGAV